jgi:hypothetical protein
MPTFRMALAIAILGALPAACSERQPIQCDAQCVIAVKNMTRSYKPILGATEEEWQEAFAVANAELAQGDWSQRLSEIQQEICRTPGKVDWKRVGDLELAMFNKLSLETQAMHIQVADAMDHPNDASGARALKQLRIQGMKDALFKVKINQFRVAC